MYIWSMFEDSFPFGYLDTVIKATNEYLIHGLRGAPVAQLVKLWPVDVGVLGSEAEILSVVKQDPCTHTRGIA